MDIVDILQLLIQPIYNRNVYRTTHKHSHEHLHPIRNCKRSKRPIFDLRLGSERGIIPVSIPSPIISTASDPLLRPDDI